MARTILNLDVIAKAAQPGLLKVAEEIAKDARRHYRIHALKTDDPNNGVIAEPTDDGARVVTHNPFAHLDEYDNGGSAFQGPSAAMRSAAAAHGKFTPE